MVASHTVIDNRGLFLGVVKGLYQVLMGVN